MRVEGDFKFADDVFDEDVWDEVEFAYRKACRLAAIAQGADANDWEETRRWARYRYVEGDPLVRAAVYYAAIERHPRSPHEAPYWWSISDVGQYVFMGDDTLLYRPEFDEAQAMLANRCADIAEAEGIDPEDEGALRAWTRRLYDEGDATVRASLYAEAVDAINHNHGWMGVERALYEVSEKGLVESSIPDAFWHRATDVEEEPDNEGPNLVDDINGIGPQWEDRDLDFVGRFASMGRDYEVWEADRSNDLPRHFHLRRPGSPRRRDICVGIYEPVYVYHGNGRTRLTEQEIADFIGFLERSHLSCYERLGYEMPDYTRLHWPEEDLR